MKAVTIAALLSAAGILFQSPGTRWVEKYLRTSSPGAGTLSFKGSAAALVALSSAAVLANHVCHYSLYPFHSELCTLVSCLFATFSPQVCPALVLSICPHSHVLPGCQSWHHAHCPSLNCSGSSFLFYMQLFPVFRIRICMLLAACIRIRIQHDKIR